MGKFRKILLIMIIQLLSGGEPSTNDGSLLHPWSQLNNRNGSLSKIGDFTYPTNPMNDRAIGYLLKGKAKSAVTNYGEFIEWDVHPAGLWGDYTYLPDVCFIAGVPGQSYSYKYEWFTSEEDPACPVSTDPNFLFWCSSDAYNDPGGKAKGFPWYDDDGDTNFVNIVFESYRDVNGILGKQKFCTTEDNCILLPPPNADPEIYSNAVDSLVLGGDGDPLNEWVLDDQNQLLVISLPTNGAYVVDPNYSNTYGDPQEKKTLGLVYPWAMRPALEQRTADFDLYDYGEDDEEWTDDDGYAYYGANVAESWFTRWNPSSNTDWQPATGARLYTHNTEVNAGDVFGEEIYVDPSSTYPLLAHSEFKETWPQEFLEDGSYDYVWPGGYAESFSPEETGCNPPKRYNDDCWVTTNRFVSNQDVYMEFNDKWAHRGSRVIDNAYESTGYPMGLNVMATAHSYSVSFAEDIMFVTVNVRNESGDDWTAFEKNRYGDRVYIADHDGSFISGDAMIMPDGTKLNGGKGFTYRDVAMGFYMDADVVSTDEYGNFGVHTNADDFMEYYDCANPLIEPDGCQVINDDTLRVSIAMIYDYDNRSGTATDIGIVGTQLLDSPYASDPVDLDGDGIDDIYPGQKLKMTDWHWFDWYTRPGVVYKEGEAGCCAGDLNAAQATNKEEMQYKIMIGDTTNLNENEKAWYFHTDDPTTDSHETNLNPHFDSLDGLELTEFFTDDPDGLDCVLEMTCGPFSLEVGEQVPFSFCIIFGQDKTDLIDNARFAQLMYNSHYQGYTEPDYPTLTAIHDKNQITLSWDHISEDSRDVVTGYADFEGYKIYKSTDGGNTWGPPSDKIYDDQGTHVGWKPYAQFHLTPKQDSTHCVFDTGYHNEPVDTIYKDIVVSIDNDHNEDDDHHHHDHDHDHEYEIVKDTTYTYYECSQGFRNMNICGPDPHNPWFSLGDCDDSEEIFDKNTQESCEALKRGTWKSATNDEEENICFYDINFNGRWDKHIGIVNKFIDYDVLDGVDYTYTVTAYDMGIAPDYEIEEIDLGDVNLVVSDTTFSSANPLHFATPDGYQYLENGRGQSSNDKNFITLKSGPSATSSFKNEIKVVPNPYMASSPFNESETTRKLRFTNLPENCRITIYTTSGEQVVSFFSNKENRHADCENIVSGSCYWDMRTLNNQEIAPGLYLYSVEDLSNPKGKKFIGKFAVVK